MKRMKFLLMPLLATVVISCGTAPQKNENAEQKDTVKKEEVKPEVKATPCPTETKLEVGAKKLKTADLAIKESWAVKVSESEIDMYFANAPKAEIDINASKLKGNQVLVKVSVKKRDKTAVAPGTYVYHYDNEKESNYMISEVKTKEGIQYLFWGNGDPNPATLTVNDISGSMICGTINAETKETESLGKQIVKGNFVVKF